MDHIEKEIDFLIREYKKLPLNEQDILYDSLLLLTKDALKVSDTRKLRRLNKNLYDDINYRKLAKLRTKAIPKLSKRSLMKEATKAILTKDSKYLKNLEKLGLRPNEYPNILDVIKNSDLYTLKYILDNNNYNKNYIYISLIEDSIRMNETDIAIYLLKRGKNLLSKSDLNKIIENIRKHNYSYDSDDSDDYDDNDDYDDDVIQYIMTNMIN